MVDIDWDSSCTHVLLNPRLSQETQEKIKAALPISSPFKRHFWLLTSGTTAASEDIKSVALSKEAVLTSAQAVNRHLASDSSDTWVNPLPLFHVGGLGIEARGYLSGATVVRFPGKWDADAFHRSLLDAKATLTALVPTQLYDLVSKKLKSPPHLRAVVIGGGRLDDHLYHAAQALGWCVLPSYGLTEASSQVATTPIGGGTSLQILSHIEAKIGEGEKILLKGESLLTAYALVKGCGAVDIVVPLKKGWLETEDRGFVTGRNLEVFGRSRDYIKIGGESVDLQRLEALFEKLKFHAGSQQATVLLAVPDRRLGYVVHLAVEGDIQEATRQAIDDFQQQVLPFERMRKQYTTSSFPRTATGKIQKPLFSTLHERCN